MSTTTSPFRDEDPQARVEVLLAERDDLLARLYDARRELAQRQRAGGWRLFFIGAAILPTLLVLTLLCILAR
jgi:hypothetical protein